MCLTGLKLTARVYKRGCRAWRPLQVIFYKQGRIMEDEAKCIHNHCDSYHYSNGTCMNIENKLKHFEECESKGCDYEELPMVQERDRSEGENV